MIQTLYLGRIPYAESLALQQELVELRHQGHIDNTLLLLEHPPVLTLGRNSNRQNILASDQLLAQRGVTIHEINRGGDVTYHGPGQLIGYPIFDLRSLPSSTGGRLGPVDFVRRLEECLIRLSACYNVLTTRISGRTGVWTIRTGTPDTEKKIAAIGIHISRGITSHGFAYNLSTDLRDFQWIVPCGIADRQVTSLELEMPVNDSHQLPTLAQFADNAARQFGHVFQQPILAVASLSDLRKSPPDRISHTPGRAATIGVPLLVPSAIERLQSAGSPAREKPRDA